MLRSLAPICAWLPIYFDLFYLNKGMAPLLRFLGSRDLLPRKKP
nr:hypothetical protein Q903MT_gene1489 [Picea sitchensis]